MYPYFLPDEAELNQVIASSLDGRDKVLTAQVIQTGWTNITMDVHGEQHDYIFRFPRNRFFADMIAKDCRFCAFINGKTRIQTPQMALLFDKGRPFSHHIKIKGTALTKRMYDLSDAGRAQIAEELAGFLTDLHKINPDQMPTDIRESLNDFLTGLATVHNGDYNISMHNELIHMEKHPDRQCIVHGDLNPGNVLVDEADHVCGIIDFAFASVSDCYADLGRFVGRAEPKLGQALVQAYQKQNQHNCLTDRIQQIVDLFQYVEFKYVQYMQSSHPEILIPAAVLDMASQYQQTHAYA